VLFDIGGGPLTAEKLVKKSLGGGMRSMGTGNFSSLQGSAKTAKCYPVEKLGYGRSVP